VSVAQGNKSPKKPQMGGAAGMPTNNLLFSDPALLVWATCSLLPNVPEAAASARSEWVVEHLTAI
jgi:hypothetical protein